MSKETVVEEIKIVHYTNKSRDAVGYQSWHENFVMPEGMVEISEDEANKIVKELATKEVADVV